MSANYEAWRNSPEGRAQIHRSMDKAKADVDAYLARKRVERDRAWDQWCKDSLERSRANSLPQSLGPNGRIDDNYTASDLPLDIGWIANANGPELVYVSLGGLNVLHVLPPTVLADIRGHIENAYDDETGRAA